MGVVTFSSRAFWPLNTALFVTDFHGNNPRFAYYALQTLDLARFNSGSAQASLNRNFIQSIPIALPELDEQERISSVLGALDDKIDSNRRLAGLLEGAGGTLFQGRFIERIHPVNGVNCKREEWPEASLADLASAHREPALGTSDLPYVGLNEMPPGSTILTDWLTNGAPEGQANRFSRSDILFGKLRPYFRKVGVAPIDGRCSTEILVLRPTDDRYWGVVLGHVSSPQFIDHCMAVSRGTRMPRAEWKDAGAFRVRVPPPQAAAEHTQTVRTLYSQIQGLVMESRSLAATRDALLPRLVAGRLRVRDATVPEHVAGPFAGEPAP